MGLESVFDKNNMRTIWRGEETAVMEGKEEGRRGCSNVLLAYWITFRLVLSLKAPANAIAPSWPILLSERLHGVG